MGNLVDGTVGWSDIELFSIFDNGHYAADHEYFCECSSKKSVNLASRVRGACAAKFSLSKITGTLKINIFVRKFAEQSTKIKFEIKMC